MEEKKLDELRAQLAVTLRQLAEVVMDEAAARGMTTAPVAGVIAGELLRAACDAHVAIMFAYGKHACAADAFVIVARDKYQTAYAAALSETEAANA